MEQLINARVKGIQISGIRQFFNLVSQYPNAVQLTIGQPDFPTPEHVKQAAIAAIEQNHTGYTPNAGIIELRQAIARFVQDNYQLNYDANTEVIVTIGASQAIDITLRTILEEDTEVILPGPVYPGYEPLIRLAGAKPVYVDTRPSGFKLSAELIAQAITSKTRAIVLPYPSNPTGVSLTARELNEIAQLLKDQNIFVIADEIYSELTYGERHTSIASFPGMKEKTIVINGVSKSHAMTGWRIGFTLAHQSITQHMLKVHQYNVSCASSISQRAALRALTEGKDDALPMREAYLQRRDFLAQRLEEIGLETIKPEGAFYLFPSIKQYGINSQEFAVRLLQEQGLAVVPGDAFSSYGEGYLRLSYAYHEDVLKEGSARLENFVRSLEINNSIN